MKTFKQLMAGVLALILFFTALPITSLPVFAETSIATDDIVWGTDSQITRAEWLHNLVVVFDMTVESEAMPDNYYSDLEESHAYYEDILLAVEFGVVHIEAGNALYPDDPVTRDFAATTLNFCLGYQLGEEATYTFTDADACSDPDSAQVAVNRGWFVLIEGAFSPETYITASEIEFMINDAAAIMERQIIDENYESTYEFAEDVIVIPDGTIVEEDENGILYITDCPETILVDDKFAVYLNGIPSVYKAISVSFVDNVTVVETESVETDDAFTAVDAEGVINSDGMEIIAADGVDVSFEEDTSAVSTFSTKKVRNITSELPISFDGITGKVAIKIKNPYIDYSVDSGRAYVALCGQTEISYGISANALEAAGLSKGFTLFTCNVAGIGSFDVTINVNFSGSATGNVKGYLVAGIECEKDVGIRAIKSFTQQEYYTNVEAETSVSLRASLGVTKMPILSGYVYAEVGVKAKFSKKTYNDEKEPTACTHFAAYLFAQYGASASAKFGIWKTSESVNYTIFDESNSPVRIVNHYEDGQLVPKCTRGTSYVHFFTKASSRWSGSGWSSANGAYGLNADRTPVALYNYTLDENNQATITSYNGNSWSVYIPSTIDGYTVVAISDAFSNKSVSRVVIPDTVTDIYYGAFEGCTDLSNVKLSNALVSLSSNAFGNCSSLSKIHIPKSVEYSGEAFLGCSGLREVTFEEGITTIPSSLFVYSGLESVTIPDTVTVIGAEAFANCYNLKTVNLSPNLTRIEYDAFYDCDNLSNVILPSNLVELGSLAFGNCSSLSQINIPKSLTYADYAFSGCSGLKEVTFEEGITEIIAFLLGGSGIESITIPDTVTVIGDKAFNNCYNLKTVNLPPNLTTIAGDAFFNCTSLSNIELPKTLVDLGSQAFGNCSSLSKVNIPKSLEDEGWWTADASAFWGCSGLREVTFEEGITTIPDAIFANSGLESITIPETVTVIGTDAFACCENLKTVKLPETLESFGYGVFFDCFSLENINIPQSITTISESAFSGCQALKSIEIPDGVTTISESAFSSCNALKNIEIPDSVTTIEDGAFAGCSSLERITLPDKLVDITNSMFSDCTSLKTIQLPDTVETIQDNAFYGCTALEEAILPESIKEIGWSAFQNCTALEKVYIPQSTKSIGPSAFMGCEKLSDVTISDYSVTWIEGDTFKDCPALGKIQLPKGLTTIGSQAFMNDTTLVEVIVPESVTSIDSTAFSYPAKTTIYGKKGSYAETFATDGGFTFVDNTIAAEGLILKDGVESITLDAGETYRAEFEFYPEDSNDVVVLTADNSRVTISGHDIYARSSGDTVITATATSGVTYEFTVHIRDASKIEIVSEPVKTTYNIGEALDLTGISVQVVYNDASVRLITDYTVSGFDSSVEGTNTITVKWIDANGSSFTKTFTVEIIDPTPELTGIFVDTLPVKQNYVLREKLDLTGLIIMGNYTDGSTSEVTDYTVSGYNALKKGTQTIKVTCGEFTTSFTIMMLPADLKFSGASLTLQDNLAINYKVSKSLFEESGYTNPYVKFVLNDVETVVTEYTVVGDNYVFDFTDIAPHMINDTVYATLYATYNGVEYASATREYSVATYGYNMLGKYTTEEYAELQTLLVDLLNYGSRTQEYLGYQTDNLANAQLTEEQAAWGTSTERTFETLQNTRYEAIENPTVLWKGAGLTLQDSITMRFKIAAESVEGLSVKVICAGGEWTVPSAEFELIEEGSYYVYFDALSAAQMSEPVYLTVYKGDTAVSHTVRYSVESYAYVKQNDADTNLVALIRAMMKYGDSAHAYVN